MKIRSFLEQTYGPYYRKKFQWMTTCIYCGNKAECDDHVFPISGLEGLELFRHATRVQFIPHGLWIVKSCNDCNHIAGNKPFISIREKRNFIHYRLREKHGVTFVEWTDEELNELGYSLKQYVIKKMREDDNNYFRIHYPRLRKLRY